jgi:hypothetical protein
MEAGAQPLALTAVTTTVPLNWLTATSARPTLELAAEQHSRFALSPAPDTSTPTQLAASAVTTATATSVPLAAASAREQRNRSAPKPVQVINTPIPTVAPTAVRMVTAINVLLTATVATAAPHSDATPQVQETSG